MDRQAVSAVGTSLFARRPEIVPAAATVLCWAALIADSPAVGWSRTGTSIAGHGAHGGVFTWSGVEMVAVMTMAMMGPLAIPGTRAVASRQWTRAGGALAWFLAAFLLVWIAISLVLATLAETLGGVMGSPITAAGVLTLGCAAAQFDPRRRGSFAACDRPNQQGDGSGPVVDAARFGVSCAARGFLLCALPMLAMLALPGSISFMAVLTVLVVADRFTEGRHRLVIAALYSVLGVGLLGLALLF